MKFIYFLMLIVCVGCAEPASDLKLHFQLPIKLKESPPRYAQFLKRVVYAEVALDSGTGVESRQIPVGDWDTYPISNLNLQDNDSLTVKVWIWDRDRQGNIRSYAALSAQRTWNSEELARARDNQKGLILKLRMHVSIKEYGKEYAD